MKKILLALLMLAMLFTFAACSEDAPEPTAAPAVEEETDVEEYEEEVIEEEAEEEAPAGENLTVGPATFTLDNVQFDLPEGWSLSYDEEDHLLTVSARDSILIMHRPDTHSIDDPATADLLTSMPFLLKSMTINALTGDHDTQDLQSFIVNDFQVPAVMSTYFAHFRGEWTDASSVVFFGESTRFIAHFFTGSAATDDILGEWMEFLQSVTFIGE